VAQPRGLRCKHIGWDDGVLGSHAIAIERRERRYLVTAADDNARKLVRRNRRQSIDRPLQLATCNRCRMHAHQHLARTRRRRLDLLNPQTVIVQPYRSHTAPLLPLLDFVPQEILPTATLLLGGVAWARVPDPWRRRPRSDADRTALPLKARGLM
jgi:hypothetical protein